jgi:hypothetical protein
MKDTQPEPERPANVKPEKSDDLAEGERDTVDESLKEHERKQDANSGRK